MPNADVDEVLAYCAALRLSRGHLIYAKGECTPVAHRIVNTDPVIEIEHPLDLTATPELVLAQVRALVTSSTISLRTPVAEALSTSPRR